MNINRRKQGKRIAEGLRLWNRVTQVKVIKVYCGKSRIARYFLVE